MTRAGSHPPSPRLVAAGFGVATVLGLLQFSVFAGPRPRYLSAWPAPLLLHLAQWWWWAAAVPLLAAAVRRWPLAPLRPANLMVLAALGLAATGVDVVLLAATGHLLGRQVPAELGPLWINRLDMHLVLYAAIVAALGAREAALQSLAEEAGASALQEQLSRAQLEVLGLQLHPHFLFNTLNAIAELVHEDRDEAARTLRELRALLSVSFERATRAEVSLAEEFQFVRAYANIQQRRFRGLVVELGASDEALHARVPHLLLQPLVENAVRHGLARRGGPGRVDVRAWRDGTALRIEVADDGSGLPADQRAADGTGLRNTRARLDRLPGGAHSLALQPRAEGGARASLCLPYQVAGSPA